MQEKKSTLNDLNDSLLQENMENVKTFGCVTIDHYYYPTLSKLIQQVVRDVCKQPQVGHSEIRWEDLV